MVWGIARFEITLTHIWWTKAALFIAKDSQFFTFNSHKDQIECLTYSILLLPGYILISIRMVRELSKEKAENNLFVSYTRKECLS